jgi:hypothetical protein
MNGKRLSIQVKYIRFGCDAELAEHYSAMLIWAICKNGNHYFIILKTNR